MKSEKLQRKLHNAENRKWLMGIYVCIWDGARGAWTVWVYCVVRSLVCVCVCFVPLKSEKHWNLVPCSCNCVLRQCSTTATCVCVCVLQTTKKATQDLFHKYQTFSSSISVSLFVVVLTANLMQANFTYTHNLWIIAIRQIHFIWMQRSLWVCVCVCK